MESRKITQRKAAGQPQPFIGGEALQQLKERVQHFRSDANTALSQLRGEANSALSAVKHDYKRASAAMHRLHDHSALLSFLHEKFPRPEANNAQAALRNRQDRSSPR